MSDNIFDRSCVEIDLDALKHNFEEIKKAVTPGTDILAVVKADAYGHGALETAKTLIDGGAAGLCLATIDEAVELRKHGITVPMMTLGFTDSSRFEDAVRYDVEQSVYSLDIAKALSDEAVKQGKTCRIHIKLDTGMSRLGYLCAGSYFEKGVENLLETVALPNLEIEGVYTHFAVSDEPGEDCEAYTRAQFKLFTEVIAAVESRGGMRFAIRHCANSGAVVSYPEMALDMVRPGLLLYGYGDEAGRLDLKPCMRFMTRVTTIKHYEPGTSVSYGRRFTTARRTRMGVLGIGYADGLPRLISNKCSFAAPGGFAPQRGSICMDMCMVDLTDLPDTHVGSEVEIFGPARPIEELAQAAQTIPYELLCAVSKRVPRVIKNF